MGKTKEVPRYKVVSMRVSDEEQKSIQELASELSVNISEMMRSALHLYAASREPSSVIGQYH
jgi:predicted transcriptional regulator